MEYGPIPADQVSRWVAEGRANGETKASVEGSMEWRPLTTYPEFALSLRAAATPGADRLTTATAPVRKTNSLAVTGATLGIISITFGLCCCHGIPFSLLGLVFSLVALDQIRSKPQLYDGQILAWAGVIFSVISILLGMILFLVFGAVNFLEGMPRHVYRF